MIKGLLLIFIGVLFLIMGQIFRSMERDSTKEMTELLAKVRCFRHEWSYHPKTSRLTCTTCGLEAGADKFEKEDQ